MWTLTTTTTGIRRWSKLKSNSYKKAGAKLTNNNIFMFASGETNKWAGLPVSKKVLSERNKYIKKLKDLDKRATNKLGTVLHWNPRFNWVIYTGIPSSNSNTPSNIVSYMKGIYDESVSEFENDLNYVKSLPL